MNVQDFLCAAGMFLFVVSYMLVVLFAGLLSWVVLLVDLPYGIMSEW